MTQAGTGTDSARVVAAQGLDESRSSELTAVCTEQWASGVSAGASSLVTRWLETFRPQAVVCSCSMALHRMVSSSDCESTAVDRYAMFGLQTPDGSLLLALR